MTAFLDTVRSTIEKHRMLKFGDRVLVGVSGGPDSLALLSSLVALRDSFGLVLRAAYVDHGLRPAACRREAVLVRKLGRLWGVPVDILRRKVRRGGGESLEAAARAVRYQALVEAAARNRCRKIALGHTRDDQAETVLMWLLRGTGTTGLAGIPPVRNLERSAAGRSLKIIRPLIESSRAEVEAALEDHRIRALQDRSNRSLKFLRNRIRHELLPLLERQYNPRMRDHLSRLAEILRTDLDWIESQGKAAFRRLARVSKDRVRLDRIRMIRLPAALRRTALRLAIEGLQGNRNGFSSRHWGMLEQRMMEKRPSPVDLPHGFRAEFPDRHGVLIRRVNLVD